MTAHPLRVGGGPVGVGWGRLRGLLERPNSTNVAYKLWSRGLYFGFERFHRTILDPSGQLLATIHGSLKPSTVSTHRRCLKLVAFLSV
jgi:hypothetical protein